MGAFDGVGAIAGGMIDPLQELIKQRFLEQIERNRVASEQARLAQGDRRLGLDEEQHAFTRQRAGVEDERYAEQAPTRIANRNYVETQTEHLKGEPLRAADKRAHEGMVAERTNLDATKRAETQHGYRMQEIGASKVAMPRDERLVQVEGPDGRPTWTRESDAVGKPAAQAARAVTGAERGVLAYYNRAKDASETITNAGPDGKSLEDRVAGAGLGTQLGLQYAPNMMQTSDQQAYRQAQRAFTEARLRKESGAAIPTAEYENDAKTYFAQPGDAPQTIAQKRQKRQTVLEGLKFSSGRAYDEFYGQPNKSGAEGDAAKRAADLIKKYGGG